MRLRQRVTFSACILLVLSISSFALAQLSTASINGVVRDAGGSVVPNAAIVLRNVDTSVENTTTSNGSGAYTLLSIMPGRYTLKATASGFAIATLCAGPSSTARPGSLAGEPIVKPPAGTTTISGHLSQSLNVSLALSTRSGDSSTTRGPESPDGEISVSAVCRRMP